MDTRVRVTLRIPAQLDERLVRIKRERNKRARRGDGDRTDVNRMATEALEILVGFWEKRLDLAPIDEQPTRAASASATPPR